MENKVEYYRKLRNLSQQALGRRIDYSHRAIGKIEKMQVRPLKRTQALLAWALDVPVSELFPEAEKNTAVA